MLLATPATPREIIYLYNVVLVNDSVHNCHWGKGVYMTSLRTNTGKCMFPHVFVYIVFSCMPCIRICFPGQIDIVTVL